MKKLIFAAILGCFLVTALPGQSDFTDTYRNFPIVISLQFHSLSMPFRDFKANFSNVGIGLGTEVSLNGKHNLAQQFNVVWYRNRAVGNGLLFYTQAAWRPTIAGNVFTELKAGAGYLLASRPVESFQAVNGKWIPVGHKGKGMFTVPIGISLGYHDPVPGTFLSPFVSYQFLVVSGYNQSVPVVPETLLQIGTSIHLAR